MSHKRNTTRLIVLVGEKLSGKEVVSNYLVKKYGFTKLRFSKILVDILNCLHLPITRVNQASLASALRERFGGGILAETLIKEIKDKYFKKVVIDGLRHPAEYETLNKIPKSVSVYITASLLTRFKRAKSRKEKVGESRFTLEDFKREEKLPTEIFIKSLGKKAKVKIVNEGGLKDLYTQIEEKLVKKFIK